MPRTNIDDLAAFIAIVREGNFTKAAGKLGVTPSALSHTMRGLEERLGVRLLARTTRSVTPTPAGERLRDTLEPMLERIDEELSSLSQFRDRPSGKVRLTASEHPIDTILMPVVCRLLVTHPDIEVELVVDYGLTDIVSERFDAGIRLGDVVAKDMIAVPIGPDMRSVVVGSPEYLERNGRPETPQDLTSHRCINLRLPTHGGLYAWEFERDGRELRVRVEGQLTVNSIAPMMPAVLGGVGLAYLPMDRVSGQLESGELVQVLDEWTPPYAGYFLYYPSRRQPTPAFTVLVDALRHRTRRDADTRLG
ncbi:LysR family transcriptional regulator [Aureimonas endophytica]|uniref:LysR family transcriptional regulator n=1 Tax=Aureimonas endophytica TaxID=2027858 RepID=A0A916ZLV4_9HYPH|nr:LysR family transcriptional regulator [Aureimonas endophytica]GGE02373.1 LysR family transcriptional regulator [Aureimonas endophytica]